MKHVEKYIEKLDRTIDVGVIEKSKLPLYGLVRACLKDVVAKKEFHMVQVRVNSTYYTYEGYYKKYYKEHGDVMKDRSKQQYKKATVKQAQNEYARKHQRRMRILKKLFDTGGFSGETRMKVEKELEAVQ